MNLLQASLKEVERYFLTKFGPAFKIKNTSKTDISHLYFQASCRQIPEWRKQIYEIYGSDTQTHKTKRERLLNAIRIASAQGINIPPSVLMAKPKNTDINFKTEEKRLYENLRRDKYPDIDPSQTYNEHSLFIMMSYGRFDVAAQIYHSANKAKKKRWNKFLIF